MSLFPSSSGSGLLTLRVWTVSRLSLILDGLLLVLLAAWVVWWPTDIFPPPPGPKVNLFLTEHHENHHRSGEVAHASITRDGQVYWLDRPVNVDELRELVRDAVLEHDLFLKRTGRSGFWHAPSGGYLSKLDVVLRVDRDACWGAVHAVLRCMGGCGVNGIHFLAAYRDGRWNRTKSSLPACLLATAPDTVFLRVKMTTAAGGALQYEVDGVPHQDPATLGDAVARKGSGLRQALGFKDPPISCYRLRGEIEADPDTSFEDVLAVLDAFLDCDMWEVSLLASGDDPTRPIRAEATRRQVPSGGR